MYSLILEMEDVTIETAKSVGIQAYVSSEAVKEYILAFVFWIYYEQLNIEALRA